MPWRNAGFSIGLMQTKKNSPPMAGCWEFFSCQFRDRSGNGFFFSNKTGFPFKFAAQDHQVRGSLDADADTIAGNTHESDLDVVSDLDRLGFFSGKDQHNGLRLRLKSGLDNGMNDADGLPFATRRNDGRFQIGCGLSASASEFSSLVVWNRCPVEP